MSKELEMFVFGNADVFQTILHAVAISMGGSAYASLIKLVGLFGLSVAVFQYIRSQNLLIFPRHLFQYILIFNLCFLPKMDLLITDKTASSAPQVVSSVPAGIAVVAWLSTHIGAALTGIVEANFTLPDDLLYNKAGFLMASHLFHQIGNFHSDSPAFSSGLKSFVHHCVFYDLMLNRYTLKNLASEEKLFAFFEKNTSGVLRFPYNGKLPLCKEGIKDLEKEWKDGQENTLKDYAQRLFSINPLKKGDEDSRIALKTKFVSQLPMGYSYLTGVSTTASEIMQQSILINAIKQGAINASSSVIGGGASMTSMAYTKAMEEKRLANKTAGMMAAYWLPLMKNVFEALLYGSFPFVFLLSLIPGGMSTLKNYFLGLMWLQLWAPLYAILNLIMTTLLKSKLQILFGGGGITLATMGSALQTNADVAGLAGYLSGSIPLISYYLLRFSTYSMTQIAGQMGGGFQGASASAAHEMVSGNISMGNTNIGNETGWCHTRNNMAFNTRYSAAGMSLETDQGSTVTYTPKKNIVQVRDSQLPTNIAFSESLATGLNQQVLDQEGVVQSNQLSYNKSKAESMAQVLQLAHHFSNSSNSGERYSVGLTADERQAAQTVDKIIESTAKSHHISSAELRQATASLSASIGASWHNPVSMVFGGDTHVSVEGRLSGSISGKHNDEELRRATMELAKNKDYQRNFAITRAAVKNNHFATNEEQGTRLNDSATASLQKTEQLSNTLSASKTALKNVMQQRNYAETHAKAINTQWGQQFKDWLGKQKRPDGTFYGETGATTLVGSPSSADKKLVTALAQKYAKNHGEIFNPMNMKKEKAKLHQGFQEAKQTYAKKSQAMEDNSNRHRAQLKSTAHIRSVNTKARDQYAQKLHRVDGKLSDRKVEINPKNVKLKAPKVPD